MKFNAIAMSVISSLSILGGVMNAQATTPTQTVHAADQVTTMYIGQSAGTRIYAEPNGKTTGRTLAFGTAWKVLNTKTAGKQVWAQLGKGQWVPMTALTRVKPAGVYYIDYAAGYSIAVHNAPNGKPTGQKLAHASAWKAVSVRTVGQATWIQVGRDQWIRADYTSTTKPATRYATATLNIRQTPGGAATGKTVASGAKLTTFQSVNGYTNIGQNAWVSSQYLSTKNPKTTVGGYTTTGVTYRMTATAYDPRVLGNYTFGYDTVAANLSRFPRGTRLAITFGNGVTKIYVVRDTGGFAYANPNQLDIAMPNSQALQFGRQNITVRVLK